ncbi:adhesion G-protein coupled receptor G2-like isoform X2 [Synchiropus splendidus]|uniref:adhesion G-protein coupled receptor G2-like isoform X2 n=1 Tax=Synchiropus splendidus TaxID=270530 RepID=UPI00237D4882|nr:adhesion G-protein coupled receptor G2-like isoform X2 [Synchiropus splendidus]
MSRMRLWLLVCHLLFVACHDITNGKDVTESSSSEEFFRGAQNQRMTTQIEPYLNDGNQQNIVRNLRSIRKVLAGDKVNETVYVKLKHFLAVLYTAKSVFSGLHIQASDSEVNTDEPVHNAKLFVELPGSLNPGSEKVLFWSIVLNATNWTVSGIQAPGDLYENRLVGLSVGVKNMTRLQHPVKITMNLTTSMNKTLKPRCVFLNYSKMAFDSDGCDTMWSCGRTNVTCVCDHLTYFGVLMITADLSTPDLTALTYISQIGSGVSLLCLFITVLLFINNRKIRADVSMRVHMNLVVALILLNVHFLAGEPVAALHSAGLCLYIALAIHYSLLATFCWMALEGFHLYLLLVRVFNIYFRKYMLKLCLVGWGVPVIIVSLVILLRRDAYGPLALDAANSTMICYITDHTVKMVSTVGVFCLVFAFNLVIFGLTVRSVLSLHYKKEYGPGNSGRAKQNIAMLVGVTVLLGITWGVIFFSFGELSTAGLYLFCIFNSIQGLFLFLWFLMSLQKTSNSRPPTSIETRSS